MSYRNALRRFDPHFDTPDDSTTADRTLPEVIHYGKMRGRPARKILDTDADANAGASVELVFQDTNFKTVLQSQRADSRDAEIVTLQVQVDNNANAQDIRADIVECRLQWGQGLTQQEAFFHPKRGTRLSLPCSWFNLSARFPRSFAVAPIGTVPAVYVSALFAYGTKPFLTKSPPVYWQESLLPGLAGATIFFLPRWADTITLFDPYNAQAIGGGLRVTFQGTAFGAFSQRTTMVAGNYYPCSHWQIPAGASRVLIENLSGLADVPIFCETGLHL